MPNDELTMNDLLEALEATVETYDKRRKLKEHPLVISAIHDEADSGDAVDQALDDFIEEAADEVRDVVKQLGKTENDDEAEKTATKGKGKK